TGHDGGATCGLAMTTGERVVVQDVLASERLNGTADLDMMKRIGIRSVQRTPLVSRDGVLVGAISTHWRTPHDPERRSLDLLDILARQSADLMERARADGELLAAQESLRSSDRRKDEFLAILAHELRNPLSPV